MFHGHEYEPSFTSKFSLSQNANEQMIEDDDVERVLLIRPIRRLQHKDMTEPCRMKRSLTCLDLVAMTSQPCDDGTSKKYERSDMRRGEKAQHSRCQVHLEYAFAATMDYPATAALERLLRNDYMVLSSDESDSSWYDDFVVVSMVPGIRSEPGLSSRKDVPVRGHQCSLSNYVAIRI